MPFIRLFSVTVAVALFAVGFAQADVFSLGGLGSSTVRLSGVDAPTQTLKGSVTNDADTIEVFYGRVRPYWRGYYHGSAGFAPRPHVFYGPIVYPRYYAYRPVYRYSYPYSYGYNYGYAYSCPCPVGYAVASAAPPITTIAETIVAVPKTVLPIPAPAVPMPPVDGSYRYDGGPVIPVPPTGALRPAQTVEPPIAATTLNNRVKAAVAKKPVYPAYGETTVTPRPAPSLLVKGSK